MRRERWLIYIGKILVLTSAVLHSVQTLSIHIPLLLKYCSELGDFVSERFQLYNIQFGHESTFSGHCFRKQENGRNAKMLVSLFN
mgnify:CR=1 FL=1